MTEKAVICPARFQGRGGTILRDCEAPHVRDRTFLENAESPRIRNPDAAKGRSGTIDLDRADVEALVEHQLITLERPTSGQRRPLITINGDSVLKAVARIR
jgi:hypothetical protein